MAFAFLQFGSHLLNSLFKNIEHCDTLCRQKQTEDITFIQILQLLYTDLDPYQSLKLYNICMYFSPRVNFQCRQSHGVRTAAGRCNLMHQHPRVD